MNSSDGEPRYSVAPGEWQMLRDEVGRYGIRDRGDIWSLRTIALEGRVTIPLEGGEFVWGGPLFDLFMALSAWEPSEVRWRFSAVDQAPLVELKNDGDRIWFAKDRVTIGSLDVATAAEVIGDLVEQFFAEVLERVPALRGWVPAPPPSTPSAG